MTMDEKNIRKQINEFINMELDIEYEYELVEKEDWEGLLKLRERQLKEHPDDLNFLQFYADALILNKKFQEAIDFLIPYYKVSFEEGFGIHPIMDALIGLGKTEKDFPWLKIPTILRLDETTLCLCIKLLKGKRKPVNAFFIYDQLLSQCDYITFDSDALSSFLIKNSDHFIITDNILFKIKK